MITIRRVNEPEDKPVYTETVCDLLLRTFPLPPIIDLKFVNRDGNQAEPTTLSGEEAISQNSFSSLPSDHDGKITSQQQFSVICFKSHDMNLKQ